MSYRAVFYTGVYAFYLFKIKVISHYFLRVVYKGNFKSQFASVRMVSIEWSHRRPCIDLIKRTKPSYMQQALILSKISILMLAEGTIVCT